MDMDIPADWIDPAKAEFFRVLMALLPGLLTVAIISALTTKQSLSALERTIQALLYTFIDNVSWYGILVFVNYILWKVSVARNIPTVQWQPSPKEQLVYLGACGILWGLLMTWVINCGKLHNLLAWTKLTKRTSRPNEWYDAFYRYESAYVCVHLKDRRRVFGWPRLYPDIPDQGHLVLEDAEWLREDGVPSARLCIMIPATQIDFVEFVKTTPKVGEEPCLEKSQIEQPEVKTESSLQRVKIAVGSEAQPQ